MEKQSVVISSKEIRETIERGDNCSGNYVLAVSPDGEARILWAEDTRQWNPWTNDEVIIDIPAMIPEGDGEYYQEAVASFDWGKNGNPTREEVEELVEDGQFWGAFDWMEQNAPDWVEAYRDNALDFLESAFESALNGYGDELNDPDPWRDQDINGYAPEELFDFEIK